MYVCSRCGEEKKLIVKLNQKREEIATRYDEFVAHLEHFPLLIAAIHRQREEMAIFRCHKLLNLNFSDRGNYST